LVDDADDVAAFESFTADDAGAAPKKEVAADPAEQEKKEESLATKDDAPKAESKTESSDGNQECLCTTGFNFFFLLTTLCH
jgi:hypothetical protein